MFTLWDWAVLVAYILGTTWLAERLAGKQQTIRDFFLGGRQLHWTVVCGSIVASEVSGVTFVSVPAIIYAAGGNYTYLMLAVGTILARIIIGIWFVPAFYRHEIYSPYEFMGKRLGPMVHRVGTAIFLIGGFLAQGARLYLAGFVLHAITGMSITWAVVLIALISVIWTWMGGITAVVWTDVIQFAVLFLGAITALVAVTYAVPGGVDGILQAGLSATDAQGAPASKFRLWNGTLDRLTEFTFWCGLASTFLTLGSHGTDQMMAQRLFCCRDYRQARKAIIASSVGVLLAVVMLTVGVGIYAYFQHHPPTPDQQLKIAQRSDYVFPFFILNAMPIGVKGLLFAAIFSAATATSTLAAMAQSGLSAFVIPFSRNALSEPTLVKISRGLIVVAAVGLTAVAIACQYMDQYKDILRLALSMAAYTYGAMLGMFLLALLPFRRDARGLIWGAGYSILLVFAMNWQHLAWARVFTSVFVAVLLALAAWLLWREPRSLLLAAAGGGLVLLVTWVKLISVEGKPAYLKLAFPWLFPIGVALTLFLGWALGRPRPLETTEPAPQS